MICGCSRGEPYMALNRSPGPRASSDAGSIVAPVVLGVPGDTDAGGVISSEGGDSARKAVMAWAGSWPLSSSGTSSIVTGRGDLGLGPSALGDPTWYASVIAMSVCWTRT